MAGILWDNIRRHHVLLLTGLLLILYTATFSGVSSVDAYYYFGNIDSGSLASLCHPHHLAYLLVGKGWFMLWRIFGYHGTALLPLKQMSLFGALGVLILFARTLSVLFPRGVAASCLLLALGTSYLPWHYSTEGEPVIFFQFFSLWILYLLVRWYFEPEPASGLAWKLGLAVGLGTLFHQSLVFAVPLSVAALLHRGQPSARISLLGKFLLPALILIAVPYIGLGFAVTNSHDPRTLVAWSTGYLDEFSGTYGLARNLHPRPILSGLASAFLGGTALKPYLLQHKPFDAGFLLAVSVFIFVLGSVGAGLLAVIFSLRRFEPPLRRGLLAVAVFTGVFLAAAIYWEPGNRKFWAPVEPGLIILMGAGLMGMPRLGPRIILSRRMGKTVLGLLCLVLVVGNLGGGILHKHRAKDLESKLALGLLEIYQPGDLLVMPADRLWQSVDYNFPEIRSAGVFAYANPAWAAQDTTMDFAAKSLWQTLTAGKTGYVSSRVEKDLSARIAALAQAAGDPAHGKLKKTFLFRFNDFEQEVQDQELSAWRWVHAKTPATR